MREGNFEPATAAAAVRSTGCYAAMDGPALASWANGGCGADRLPRACIVIGIIFQISRPLGLILGSGVPGVRHLEPDPTGNTGQTVGKKQMGIKLLREQDGQVVGPAVHRTAFVHIVDSLPCYIGCSSALDPKRQTLRTRYPAHGRHRRLTTSPNRVA